MSTPDGCPDAACQRPIPQLVIARALDAVAQFVDPRDDGRVVVRADDDTVEFVRAVLGLAVGFAYLLHPELNDAEIAEGLRLQAHSIREVESSVGG